MENKIMIKPLTDTTESISFSETPTPLYEKKRKVMHKWTDEEDQTLCLLVSKKGSTQWSAIAKSIPGRSGKQCRERWYNHLNPSITHLPWTDEEDDRLREYQRKMGNQWTKIAEKLSGRSENEVKNRANSLIRKAKTMTKRFQKSMNKLIPPPSRPMINGVAPVDPVATQSPVYFNPMMASNGYPYKSVMYSYDPSKPLPAVTGPSATPVPSTGMPQNLSPLPMSMTNSPATGSTPMNSNVNVKRQADMPPMYYPSYGYTIPMDKSQPYEVVPNFPYPMTTKSPYEYPVVSSSPAYMTYPGQPYMTAPSAAAPSATSASQQPVSVAYTMSPYPTYQPVYAVNSQATIPMNSQYMSKRYPTNAIYNPVYSPVEGMVPNQTQSDALYTMPNAKLAKEVPKTENQMNCIPKVNVQPIKSEYITVKKEKNVDKAVATPAAASNIPVSTNNNTSNSSNYDSSSSDSSDDKENYNQSKIDILQQVCHQVMNTK